MSKICSIAIVLSLAAVCFGQTAKPEFTAKSFYKAWVNQNKRQLKVLATAEVSEMSVLKNPPDPSMKYKFENCVWDRMENGWYCVWRSQTADQATIEMLLQKTKGKMLVTFVELR